MPDSVLDNRLLGDALVGVVDGIRSTIDDALGLKPYRVAIVTRRWSGGELGIGTPSDTVLELEPVPDVELVTNDRLGPGGREAAGRLVLTGVSLRYSERELAPSRDTGAEYAYRLTEARGQGQAPKYFVLDGDPVPRRDYSDWKLVLEETSALSSMEATDA